MWVMVFDEAFCESLKALKILFLVASRRLEHANLPPKIPRWARIKPIRLQSLRMGRGQRTQSTLRGHFHLQLNVLPATIQPNLLHDFRCYVSSNVHSTAGFSGHVWRWSGCRGDSDQQRHVQHEQQSRHAQLSLGAWLHRLDHRDLWRWSDVKNFNCFYLISGRDVLDECAVISEKGLE